MLSLISSRDIRPWAIGENYFISWHPFQKHLVYGLFERLIGTLLPKKVPKPKTCPIPRKRLICDFLVLNCITVYCSKKREIFKSTITKMTCSMRKSTKKRYIRHLNSFSVSSIVLESYAVKHLFLSYYPVNIAQFWFNLNI